VSFRHPALGVAALAALASACRHAPPPAIDPAMAACVPPSVTVLAGVDLARLRVSPLYPQLPTALTALLDPLHEARTLLIGSDGRELLVVARGDFRQPPAGATMLAGGIALSGTPGILASAIAQQKTGRTGASGLIDYASTIAPGKEVWIAAQGGVALPLMGNAANLSRLLRDCEHAALTVHLNGAIDLTLTATGRTPESARQVEETLRATITLTAASESRRPELVALLKSIRLTREDRAVKAALTASPDQVRLLQNLY
jgi:hypothetical protein